MKNKRLLAINISIALVTLSIVTVIICFFLNIIEFEGGGLATIKNVIVTFSYIAVWIFVLIIGVKIKSRGLVQYCSIFGIITLLTSILMVYLNATRTQNDWVLVFWILLIGQWYGIRFFVLNTISHSIIIAIISILMVAISVISLKHIKSL